MSNSNDMKIFKQLLSVLVTLLTLCFFSSCDQTITVESVVHEDGAIDRTIVLLDDDSAKISENFFGLPAEGWKTSLEAVTGPEHEGKPKYNITFKKHFTSVDDANNDMDRKADTLFRIRSNFEKKFRLFYTYMNYSDTYVALNRFKSVSATDYFTQEDFAFIDRLPAEGKPISRADSLYLQLLNEKAGDHFAARAIYEECFDTMVDVLNKNAFESRWMDSLARHKKSLFHKFARSENYESFMYAVLDSLNIPAPPQMAQEEYKSIIRGLDVRLAFMQTGLEAKITHSIKMPWAVVKTNADSTNGQQLFWIPPVARFMLKDYTMYAEARKINYWVVIAAAVLIIVTLFAFLRRKRTAI